MGFVFQHLRSFSRTFLATIIVAGICAPATLFAMCKTKDRTEFYRHLFAEHSGFTKPSAEVEPFFSNLSGFDNFTSHQTKAPSSHDLNWFHAAFETSSQFSYEASEQGFQQMVSHLEKGNLFGLNNINEVHIEHYSLNEAQLKLLAEKPELADVLINRTNKGVAERIPHTENGNHFHRGTAKLKVFDLPKLPEDLSRIDPKVLAVRERLTNNNYNLIIEEAGHVLQGFKDNMHSPLYDSYRKAVNVEYDPEVEIMAYLYENRGPGATEDLWERYRARNHLRKWIDKNHAELKAKGLIERPIRLKPAAQPLVAYSDMMAGGDRLKEINQLTGAPSNLSLEQAISQLRLDRMADLNGMSIADIKAAGSAGAYRTLELHYVRPPSRFTPDQIAHVAKWANEKGFHFEQNTLNELWTLSLIRDGSPSFMKRVSQFQARFQSNAQMMKALKDLKLVP